MFRPYVKNALRLYADPKEVLRDLFRRAPGLTFEARLRWDALPRPFYAYGMYHAALQAKALHISEISAIEFGVAGGQGLIEMERLAAAIARATGVRIAIYGFDTGCGNPPPRDYRDVPFVWKAGQFAMDGDKLRRRLKSAQLVIGEVGDSIRTFSDAYAPSPIGFLAFDMDYYSATKDAFRLLAEGPERFLPRAFCYFDDIVGDDTELHCEFIGELLAIREFNGEHADKKLAPIYGLAYKRRVPAAWHVKTYVLHRFDHPLYERFINPKSDWQLPL
jgi:hypothetical protein